MSSAIYLRPLHFTIDCDKAVLKVSDGVQNYSFCGAKHPPAYQVYSGNGQLKISLENLKGDLQGQYFGFEYFTENLGMILQSFSLTFSYFQLLSITLNYLLLSL